MNILVVPTLQVKHLKTILARNMSTNASREEIADGRAFTQHGTKVYNGEDYMNVLYKKQNANIDYENKQNISRVSQSIVGKENTSRPTAQRVPLANIPEIERTKCNFKHT